MNGKGDSGHFWSLLHGVMTSAEFGLCKRYTNSLSARNGLRGGNEGSPGLAWNGGSGAVHETISFLALTSMSRRSLMRKELRSTSQSLGPPHASVSSAPISMVSSFCCLIASEFRIMAVAVVRFLRVPHPCACTFGHRPRLVLIAARNAGSLSVSWA